MLLNYIYVIYLRHNITQMNTKVNKLEELYNMRSNKAARIVSLIDNYIPDFYTNEVIRRCKACGIVVNSQKVRNVKTFRRSDPVILYVILEFALENKKAQDRLVSYVTE